jgi:hypothetical protein
MYEIIISETAENKLDFVEILRRIADLIESGSTAVIEPEFNIQLKE